MMRNIRKSGFLLLSLVLVAAISVGVSFAYFTDYDQHKGQAKLNLSHMTEVDEHVDGTQKTISIKNTGVEGENASCVVKVLIYGPEGMSVELKEANDWTKLDTDDGFVYYYNHVLAPGKSTSEIVAEVKDVPQEENLEGFEVIVLQESKIFTIDEDGYVIAPDDWDDFPEIKA